jgi:hypothetical protein
MPIDFTSTAHLPVKKITSDTETKRSHQQDLTIPGNLSIDPNAIRACHDMDVILLRDPHSKSLLNPDPSSPLLGAKRDWV